MLQALEQRAFHRPPVQVGKIGGKLVGGLQEVEQRRVGCGRLAHAVVREDELAEVLAEERRVRPESAPLANPAGCG